MKRDPRLNAFSHEHQRGLVLARRAVLAADEHTRDFAAAWKETVRTFKDEVESHFQVEEQLLLPLLLAIGERKLVEKTLRQHDTLRQLIANTDKKPAELLRKFGKKLIEHIEFKERDLFETAQKCLTDAELDAIAEACEAQAID